MLASPDSDTNLLKALRDRVAVCVYLGRISQLFVDVIKDAIS